jgi:hypothetical protein
MAGWAERSMGKPALVGALRRQVEVEKLGQFVPAFSARDICPRRDSTALGDVLGKATLLRGGLPAPSVGPAVSLEGVRAHCQQKPGTTAPLKSQRIMSSGH